ncbi:MAG: lipocalin family protein [Rhodobacteraceae bacterium]|nr:lipocalin family protein [Paracoccaceae bacterium]
MRVRIALATLVVLALTLATVPPAAAQGYRDRAVPMRVVETLDLERYQGLWYEIARFPNRFERGCAAVTAEYTLRADGQVDVRNTCRRGGPDGPAEAIEGVARVEGPGRLSVSFVSWLPFARGDYWVLAVDRDYRVAVVGTPAGRTGWILARNPRITPAQLEAALAALVRNGYDVTALEFVEHP